MSDRGCSWVWSGCILTVSWVSKGNGSRFPSALPFFISIYHSRLLSVSCHVCAAEWTGCGSAFLKEGGDSHFYRNRYLHRAVGDLRRRSRRRDI